MAYDNFETYCRERWDMSGSHAHRLVDSAQVMQNLKDSPNGELPQKESQVRPLVILPPAHQREVWNEAVVSSPNGKPTAKEVVATIARMSIGKLSVGLHGKVTNSAVLKQLKALWNEAGARDKEAFRKWIA